MGCRIVRFTSQTFAELFTEGKTFPDRPDERLAIVKGLPAGAVLVDAKVDFGVHGAILVKFSHPSWEGPEDGEPVPYIQFQTMVEVNPGWHTISAVDTDKDGRLFTATSPDFTRPFGDEYQG